MSGTAISSNGGGGGKIGDKAFVKGSRGTLFYLVRSDVAQALADKDGELMPMIADSLGRIPVKDAQIPDILEALGAIGITNESLATLIAGITISNSVKVQTKTVSCPESPKIIEGVGAAAEYADGDVMGKLMELKVPKSGVIYSSTLWDLDDEGKQIDLMLFKGSISHAADNAAYAPTDADTLKMFCNISHFSFTDLGNSRISEVMNIGKAYYAPRGKIYVLARARGTHNIATDQEPRFQIDILADNPEWER